MNSKKRSLKNSRLYLILDAEVCKTNQALTRVLSGAIKGGIDIVQLRDKVSPTKDVLRRAKILLKICRKNKIPFIVNDRLDIALAVDSDGLHLGQDDLPISLARSIFGKDKIIGLSCHSLKDIKKAQKEQADYFGFGPVFKTKTKPKLRPRGITELRKALMITNKPVFAIGGIDKERAESILTKIGDLRIAVCRHMCLAKNTEDTTRKLKQLFKNV